MKKNLTIKEVKLLPRETNFNTIGIVARLTRRKDKNGNPFWEMTVSDSSGELDGKIWLNSNWWTLQNSDKLPVNPDTTQLKFEGATVGIQGRVGEFREQVQFNFSEIYYLDQNKYPPHVYAKHSPLSMEYLEAEFRKIINEVDEPLNNFLEAVFFKHGLWDDFKFWPAAVSLHHAYTGGLLEHSLSVAKSARVIAMHYKEFLIPVNLNVVIAGALLHDIGKLDAYSLAPVPLITIQGNVIEHILLGHHKFMNIAEAEKLDESLALAIAHIIVSHHGRREYGSPVLPATTEAMIINAADDLDFKLNYWLNQIEALSPQSNVTDYLPMIERRLWRGTI